MIIRADRTNDESIEVSLNGYSLKAILLSRNQVGALTERKKGIYVLMDWRRACCYVGQSGTAQDGIGSRIKSHNRDSEPWWDYVVYFIGGNDELAMDNDLRLWLEYELHTRASKTFTVMSHVDRRPPMEDVTFLPQILDLCKILGVPFFSPLPNGISSTPLFDFVDSRNAGNNEPCGRHSLSRHSRQHRAQYKYPMMSFGLWGDATSLAKALNEKWGGGVQAHRQRIMPSYLPSRGGFPRAGDDWHERYKSVKIRFDAEGYVCDCSEVPRPLP